MTIRRWGDVTVRRVQCSCQEDSVITDNNDPFKGISEFVSSFPLVIGVKQNPPKLESTPPICNSISSEVLMHYLFFVPRNSTDTKSKEMTARSRIRISRAALKSASRCVCVFFLEILKTLWAEFQPQLYAREGSGGGGGGA